MEQGHALLPIMPHAGPCLWITWPSLPLPQCSHCHQSATDLPLLIPPSDGAKLKPGIEPLMINSRFLLCPQNKVKRTKHKRRGRRGRDEWKERRIEGREVKKSQHFLKTGRAKEMEGVALQADQAIKHISGSLLSQQHQRGPGQFGGRRKKLRSAERERDKKTESRKREAILPPRPLFPSVRF